MCSIFAELYKPKTLQYTDYMNEADFDKEFSMPEKTINDIKREIEESDGPTK